MSTSFNFTVAADIDVDDASGGARKQRVREARRYLDAKSRDYVVLAGELQQDHGFTSQVVLALGTRLGSCLVLPEFGSRIHEVRRADEQGRMLAEKHAVRALQHLTGRFKDLHVVASISTKRPGAIELEVSGKRGEVDLSTKYSASVGGS
jgi:phage gp46-like protein